MKVKIKKGTRSGKLVLQEFLGKVDNTNKRFWKCLCDCGNIKIVSTKNLYNRVIKSCGCLQNQGINDNEFKYTLEPGESTRNYLLYNYKRGAEKRNLSFNLDKIQFKNLITSNCYYCGIEPSQHLKRKTYQYELFYNGIDRLNNIIGYEISNCVSCCGTCNKMKLTKSKEEFIIHIKKIAGRF